MLRVKDWSDEVKVARDQAHLTQVELAARLGVSPRTVQNWETGTMPRAKHRRAIRAFLDELVEEAA